MSKIERLTNGLKKLLGTQVKQETSAPTLKQEVVTPFKTEDMEFVGPPQAWNPKGYPPEYIAGFQIPDEEAVESMYARLRKDKFTVDGIVVELKNNGAEVYTKSLFKDDDNKPMVFLSSLNWGEPGKVPGDYEQYAATFWDFAGPEEQQLTRGSMLAKKFSVDMKVKDSRIYNSR